MRILLAVFATLIINTCLSGQSSLVLTEIMYNSPGEDVEFLEFYNNSEDTLNLTGYEIVEGVEYLFPEIDLAPEEIFVITNDSIHFNRNYRGVHASEWTSGSLRNSGEQLAIVNNQLDTIINLVYDDVAPWPHLADGLGPSIKLCDKTGPMDDPNNWQTNYYRRNISLSQGGHLYADPGLITGCGGGNGFWLALPEFPRELENELTIDIPVYYEIPSNTEITVYARPEDAISTATLDEDYRIISDTLNYTPGQTAPEFITIQILEDSEIELNEGIRFELVDATTNIPIFLLSDTNIDLMILDDDGPVSNNLELRGIIDAPQFKAIEMYAKEGLDRNRLLDFGLGSANNGNGSDSIEHNIQGFVIPDEACFFVTNDTVEIKRFLGPIDNELLILIEDLDFNGNDAIELYERGQLIDVFGSIDEDGEGTEWEYTDGWAKKKSGGNNVDFVVDDWDYSLPGLLDVDSNIESSAPYPLECIPTATETLRIAPVLIYPNPSTGQFTIKTSKPIENISIVDVMGRNIYHEQNIQRKEHQVSLSSAYKGLYFLHYKSDDISGVFRIVLE